MGIHWLERDHCLCIGTGHLAAKCFSIFKRKSEILEEKLNLCVIYI